MGKLYYNKGTDMIKLGTVLPDLADSCLHSSTSAKFFQFRESEVSLSKFEECMVGRPSIVSTGTTVVQRVASASPQFFAN